MFMPNYAYKCCKCKSIVKKDLQISTDPKKIFPCECGYTMSRIIVPGALFPEKVGKVWAGDWFKKTYGHDISEAAKQKGQERMEYDAAKLKLEQDGVKISHKSRQVGGKDRIIVPDKKDS
jgi:predicted nucleic acid-binding Zn ribbon protein